MEECFGEIMYNSGTKQCSNRHYYFSQSSKLQVCIVHPNSFCFFRSELIQTNKRQFSNCNRHVGWSIALGYCLGDPSHWAFIWSYRSKMCHWAEVYGKSS